MESLSERKGIRIETFMLCMALAACLLFGAALYGTVRTQQTYDELVAAEENRLTCEKAAAQLREGSDILTEQARLYVVTGERMYAEAYVQEAEQNRLRERALADLGALSVSDNIYGYLQSALNYSNALMAREIRAMRLTAESRGEVSLMPEAVRKIGLGASDAAQNAAGKRDLARDLMFGPGYAQAKELIDNNVDYCVATIRADTEDKRAQSKALMQGRIRWQQAHTALLFAMNVFLFAMLFALVIRPLRDGLRCVNENRMLRADGAYELRYLAQTYNKVCEMNAANEVMLRHWTESDALTGLMNRGAFEQLKAALGEKPLPVALLLIDADGFGRINERYGYETGDKTLRLIASTLTNSFRSTDFVARIGGDEFAVVMTEPDVDCRGAIRRKAERINALLQSGVSGLPPVTLSVGAVFAAGGFDEGLYRRAERALRAARERGAGELAFDD